MENMEKNIYVDEVTGEAVIFDKADGLFPTGVYLTRERVPSQKLKKMLWIYYVKGEIRGKEVKANFAPSGKDDVATFTNLDIIFGTENTAQIYEKRTTTERNEKKVTYISYQVYWQDEFGEDFIATVKPQKDSDKSIFEYLCKRVKKLAEVEAAEAAQSAEGGDVPTSPETPAEKPEKNKKG